MRTSDWCLLSSLHAEDTLVFPHSNVPGYLQMSLLTVQTEHNFRESRLLAHYHSNRVSLKILRIINNGLTNDI